VSLAFFGFPYTPVLLLLQRLARGTAAMPILLEEAIQAREATIIVEACNTLNFEFLKFA
jgi:hypothetical protein